LRQQLLLSLPADVGLLFGRLEVKSVVSNAPGTVFLVVGLVRRFHKVDAG
jgi:hypothetical protein